MKLLKIFTTFTLASIAFTTSAAEFEIKYAHSDPLSEISKGQVPAEFFKNYVEANSNGRIEVNIFPAGQLGGDVAHIQQIQAGAVDITTTSIGGLANFVPEVQALDIPYMIKSDYEVDKFRKSDYVNDIRQAIKSKLNNVNVVAIGSMGWRSFLTTNQQVKKADDLKGLKLRAIPSKLHQEIIRSLDASPITVSIGEVYTGLSTGLVHGVNNSVGDVVEFGWNDQIKYAIQDNHINILSFFSFNERKLKSMPEDLQAIVIEGVKLATDIQTNFVRSRVIPSEREFVASGGTIYTPTNAELDSLKNATTEPVTQWYEKAYGDKWTNITKKYLKQIRDDKAIEVKKVVN